MSYAQKSVDKMADIGDHLGESLGKLVRSGAKHGVSILIIALVGTVVFISSFLYRAWKSKKKENEEMMIGL